MITIPELWLPILAAAVLVWIASAVVWMVLPHHKSEYRALPDEAAAGAALKGAAPGLYNLPHVEDYGRLKDPETRRRFDEGPLAFLTVVPNGVPAMGPRLVLSFVFFLAVSVVVAYVTGRALPAGTHYLTVFRIAGTAAWLAYGFGVIPQSIWFGRPWSSAVKDLLDGLLYGLLTAGVFGSMWPKPMAG